MKGKTHDLNHDLTFSAHTINCVCHSVRLMFRVLGIYDFGRWIKRLKVGLKKWHGRTYLNIGSKEKGVRETSDDDVTALIINPNMS